MQIALTFRNGELDGRTFQFASPKTVTLGRAEGCDIVLFDKRVSRRHVTIHVEESGARVQDLGSANGTLLNETPLNGTAPLTHGDRIQVSSIDVTVSVGMDLASVTPPRPVRLETPDRLLGRDEKPTIPGYEVLTCLGEGVFGAVYEARTDQGQRVAIKVAKHRATMTQDDRLRFIREAETAATLVHPNVVRIVDHGEAGQRLYITMEFVRGEALGTLLDRRGPLPVEVALQITRAIGDALEAARLANIVHRDVKPDNIIIREDGVAKLTDFGFAKNVLNAGQSGLTRPGEVVGTVAYMSPEQLTSSLHAEHRSDIYSLGATLYHMLSGRVPFTQHVSMELFQEILEKPPVPVAELRPEVPSVVSKLVSCCLAKKPDARYQTAGELVQQLDHILSDSLGATAF
jgi:serine/threonine protein kinase